MLRPAFFQFLMDKLNMIEKVLKIILSTFENQYRLIQSYVHLRGHVFQIFNIWSRIAMQKMWKICGSWKV